MLQSLDANCAVRLTGHLDGDRHLIEFDLLQDIDQPKFFLRPLLPAQGPSEEIAQSVRALSRLRYGTEREDVERMLKLRHLRRTSYASTHNVTKQPQKARASQSAWTEHAAYVLSTVSGSADAAVFQANARSKQTIGHATWNKKEQADSDASDEQQEKASQTWG